MPELARPADIDEVLRVLGLDRLRVRNLDLQLDGYTAEVCILDRDGRMVVNGDDVLTTTIRGSWAHLWRIDPPTPPTGFA